MQRKNILKLFIAGTLTFGIALLAIATQATPVSAGNVTYKSLFSNDNCSLATGTLTISATQQVDFDAGRGVDVASVGRIYKAGTISLCCYEQYVLGKQPAACKTNFITHNATSTDPWFASSQGDIYTRYGVPYTKTPTAGYFLTNAKQSKVTEFTYSSSQNPATRTNLSFSSYLLLDYDSPSTKPPALSGFTGWYDYTKRLVQVNTGITTKAGLTAVTGAIGTALGTTTGGAFQAPGDLTINASSICNVRALVFVEGNLTINPPFKLQDITAQQACLFIVKGKVTIAAGTVASAVTGVKTDTVFYDLLQAGIISQSEIVGAVDAKEGLKVEGFLSAQGTNIQRDTASVNHPSLWVEYDPRYVEYFKEELKLLKFSTREKGFVPPI